MDLLRKFIKEFPEGANGRIIVAEELNCAKGRFERKWFAEKGGLWLSLSIYDEFIEKNRGLFMLSIGLAMLRCAHEFGITSARIKWINDVHINGRKLGGVLVERFEEWYLIGIGMNVNNKLPSNLPAISFKEVLEKEVSVIKVLWGLIKWLRFYFGFLRCYERKRLAEEEIKNLILEDYRIFCDSIGRCVCYSYNLDKEEFVIGECLNIDDKGKIILKTSQGIFKFSSGEILYV